MGGGRGALPGGAALWAVLGFGGHRPPDAWTLPPLKRWTKLLKAMRRSAERYRVETLETLRPQSALKFFLDSFSFKKKNHSWGPAATRALPASLPVYFTKFFTKRPARSLAFSSHWAASA